jgi:ribonuclease HI
VEHTLLFCHYAQEVWSRVKARTHLKLHRSLFTTTKSWVFDFLDRASDQAVIILAVTVWHIWNARNGARHDEPIKHPHSLAEQILAYIDMIQLHLIKHRTNHRREATAPTPSWSPPPEGTIVINVDAALFSASSRTGVGVVVRNHKGEFLAAHSQLLDETMTPEIAEAHAIRCAVSLARDEGWNRIVLASDCLAVIQRIKAPERDRSLVGVVIEDIKFLAHSLSSVTFRHVSRLCNNSAHTLAR